MNRQDHLSTLRDVFDRNVRLYPDRPAYFYEGRATSFRTYGERVYRLVAALEDRGVRRQDRVAVLAQNGPAYLEAYAACEVAGFILVPVNYRLAPGEVDFVLTDAGPTVLLFDSEYADMVEALRPSHPGLRSVIVIGEAVDGATGYEAALAAAEPRTPATRPVPEDIAYLIYTSGTTGRPKGAMHDHRGQVAFGEILASEMGMNVDDRILIVMPFYHIGAKCNQLAAGFRGGAIVLMRKYSAEGVAQELERHRATLAHLAPLMVQELVAEQRAHPRDHTALRLVQYASGPMPLEPLRRALKTYGPIFMQVYGMTETGLGTILHPRDHQPDGTEAEQQRLESAGQPCLHFAIRIVDDTGKDMSAGEMGEILISGPCLMQGYWRQDRVSAETVRDGWMHTGDIGSLDEEGYLTIRDRKKDIIISGGENIFPRDVEEALYRHEDVAEAAVIGVPDERWGEAVKAFVVLRPGAAPDEAGLIEFCRRHIASYKKPKSIDFVAELPRLPNKKIDKKLLREPYWSGRARNVN